MVRGRVILVVRRTVDERHDRAAWQRPDEVVDSLGIRPGGQVVDIGAGIGYFERFLARAVGDSGVVYAQEIEPELARYLEDLAEREGTLHNRAVC